MKNINSPVEQFIIKQERFYNKPIMPFTKFLLREFSNGMIGNQGTVEIKPILPELKKVTGDKIKVAFISEEIGSLTGGRYYAWFIACALVELGYDVTLYTNSKPAYYDAFQNFKVPNLDLVHTKDDLENLDVAADIYIGSPLRGNLAVTNLSEKYHKPGYCLIFDPAPLMIHYLHSSFSGWEVLVKKIRNSKVKIISLCETTGKAIPEWLNKTEAEIFPINPCINSIELDLVDKSKIERQDYVLFISRLVPHKKFDDVLKAVKGTSMRLKVIASSSGIDEMAMIKKEKMEDRVDFHRKITDLEKFEIIYGARAVISGSIFEGFGMWAAEAVATGTPLVCYDFYTIREIQKISGVDNFYYAKYMDVKSLTEQLEKCLKEAKFRERSRVFDFEAMINRVAQVFSPEPRIGVVTIALNEDKFIGASLTSTIKHPNIKKVAVIEGAVNLYPVSTKKGLSVDGTRNEVLKAMKLKNGDKIIYEQYGWANDKSELRNRALTLLGKDLDYILVVDADEVWKQEDLNGLVQAMKDHPRIGVLLFDFYHFWKTGDQVAVGGQWESQMFRCFKYADKNLHWREHGAPVVNSDEKFLNATDGSFVVPDIHVYHYGYMKDPERVREKLEYYKKRDGKVLDVKDTFTNWKKGQPTQPTHGGGDVAKFEGTHPEEVMGII